MRLDRRAGRLYNGGADPGLSDFMETDSFLLNAARPVGSDGEAILLRMNNSHAEMAAWAFGFLHPAPDAAALDVGCGGGANLATLLEMCPQGSATGVDYSEVSVGLSSRLNAEAIEQGRCRVMQGDVCCLPFEDDHFDVATAFETLYFWPDPVGGLRELRRVLRPGGTLLVCHEADGSRPGDDLWPQRIPGMRVYSAEQLAELLTAAGLAAVETHKGPRAGWVCALGLA